MKRALAILALSSTVAIAQQAAPAPAPAPAAPEVYTLKNRSAFTLASDTRAPFLPIGHRKGNSPVVASPVKTNATPVIKSLELRPEHFTVTSVLSGQPGQIALATINGRSFAEGEVIPVVFNGQNVSVLVRAIRDGGVTLEYELKQIYVPMKRSEVPTNRLPGNPGPDLKQPGSIIIDTQPSRPGKVR